MIYLIIIGLAVYILTALAFFNLAKKAQLDGIAWFSFIPVLSTILQLKMIQKSGWWILILLVPIANFIFTIIWQVSLLNAFGKNGAHVLFAIFLSPVYAILWMVWGFSSQTTYRLNGNTTKA